MKFGIFDVKMTVQFSEELNVADTELYVTNVLEGIVGQFQMAWEGVKITFDPSVEVNLNIGETSKAIQKMQDDEDSVNRNRGRGAN